jgi:hypothetical protein
LSKTGSRLSALNESVSGNSFPMFIQLLTAAVQIYVLAK